MAEDASAGGREQIDWLGWARTVQSVSQNGLQHTDSEFDRERYRKLHDLALEILAAHTGVEVPSLERWFAAQGGYATPKVDVRSACFRDGRVLLVRERSDGRWCLPGGWADVGDRPSEAAEREVLEESGIECRATKVIAVVDANRRGDLGLHHAFKIIFLCEITGGSPRPSHETLEVGFYGRGDRPPLSEGRTHPRQLEECFAHLDDPSRPTRFD